MHAVIYGRVNPFCTYCEQAKQLLASRDIPFTFLDINDDGVLDEMKAIFPGAKTVPQIVIDQVPLQGGFSGLKNMIG
jgi:glutaredoxin